MMDPEPDAAAPGSGRDGAPVLLGCELDDVGAGDPDTPRLETGPALAVGAGWRLSFAWMFSRAAWRIRMPLSQP
jgi:hypothetical protein